MGRGKTGEIELNSFLKRRINLSSFSRKLVQYCDSEQPTCPCPSSNWLFGSQGRREEPVLVSPNDFLPLWRSIFLLLCRVKGGRSVTKRVALLRESVPNTREYNGNGENSNSQFPRWSSSIHSWWMHVQQQQGESESQFFYFIQFFLVFYGMSQVRPYACANNWTLLGALPTERASEPGNRKLER